VASSSLSTGKSTVSGVTLCAFASLIIALKTLSIKSSGVRLDAVTLANCVKVRERMLFVGVREVESDEVDSSKSVASDRIATSGVTLVVVMVATTSRAIRIDTVSEVLLTAETLATTLREMSSDIVSGVTLVAAASPVCWRSKPRIVASDVTVLAVTVLVATAKREVAGVTLTAVADVDSSNRPAIERTTVSDVILAAVIAALRFRNTDRMEEGVTLAAVAVPVAVRSSERIDVSEVTLAVAIELVVSLVTARVSVSGVLLIELVELIEALATSKATVPEVTLVAVAEAVCS